MIENMTLTTLVTRGPVDRTPLLFIHGAFCDYRVWEDVVRVIGGRYPAICPSFQGYFPDERVPEDFSAAKNVEALLAIIDRKALNKVRLVGHSRGGRIAMAAAALIPEKIEALVLAEAGGIAESDFFGTAPRSKGDVAALHNQVAALVECNQREEAMKRYIDANQGAGTWVSLPSVLRRTMPDNAHTVVGMISDSSCPLSRSAVEAIRCPILLMEGSDSPPIFKQVNDVIEECGASVFRAHFEGSDHFFPSRDPEGFVAELLKFFERVAQDAGD